MSTSHATWPSLSRLNECNVDIVLYRNYKRIAKSLTDLTGDDWHAGQCPWVPKLGLDTLWNFWHARGVIAAIIDEKSEG